MIGTGVEVTVVLTGLVLWFAQGWYLNERLRAVHGKLDLIADQFDGLRKYLYEIDPQFDDERYSGAAIENRESLFAGLNDMKLLRDKEKVGKRTLNTAFGSEQ